MKVKGRQEWRSFTASFRAGQLSSSATSVSQSRGQFEGCVTESLQTITAIFFRSADKETAVTDQHARIWWKCLCPFSEGTLQAVSPSCLKEIVVRCNSWVPTGSVCFSVLYCAEVEGFVDDITASMGEVHKELAGIAGTVLKYVKRV